MKTSHWHIRHSLLLFVLIAGRVISFSQPLSTAPNFIITKRWLSVEDGLPSRVVNAAVQDNAGFMWFATANGLSRYDGNAFKTFNTKNSKLQSDFVSALTVDLDNHLYVKYGSAPKHSIQAPAVDVLDLNDNSIKTLKDIFPDLPFNPVHIQSVSNDDSGHLFFLVSAPHQIWQYHKKSGFRLRSDIKRLSDKGSGYIPDLAGLTRSNGNAATAISESNLANMISPDTEFDIKSGNSTVTRLIRNNKHGDIIYFDIAARLYHAIDRQGIKTGIPVGLSDKFAPQKTRAQLSFYGNGLLCLIDKYDQWHVLEGGKFIAVRDTNDIHTGGKSSIETAYRDRLNNVWFSTARGIYQVRIFENKFQRLFSDQQTVDFKFSTRGIYAELNPFHHNEKTVYALAENQNLMLQNSKGFTTLDVPGGFALLKRKDILYIANSQLLGYDAVHHSVSTLTRNVNIGEIWTLASFSDSLLLLGASSGLLLYNEITHQTRPVRLLQNVKQPLVNVYRILKTKQKGWIAAAENGIYFINDRLEIYDYYGKQHQLTEKRLPFTGIYDFYEDKLGVAWLAMNGEGLIRWNWNARYPMAAENIKKFTVNDGLPDNILYRIEEDGHDHLWISSYNGLLKFNKLDLSARIYRAEDGLANAEFNRVSSFKGQDGWLYFGGFNGVDAFNPANLENENEGTMLPFQLVEVTKFSEMQNSLIDVFHEFQTDKKLVMNVGDRFITVSFALLDFEKRPHRYRYRIEGMDKDWNYINENTIRISGLPYGKLTLRINAQLSSGIWNAQEIIMPIEVLKPYYLQGWFWGVSLFSFTFLFFLIYFIRTNKLNRDKLKLEALVQKRTNSLHLALGDKELLLKEIHHRVKNNLQVISGLLQLQKDDLQDENAQAALSEGQSRVSSIALIHQNLYQNKDLGNIEFKVFLQDLSKQIAELFESETRIMKVVLRLDETYIDIDTAVPLGLIVNELLTNSYKYAFGNTRNPQIEIAVKRMAIGSYQLVYRDNGPGLKAPLDFKNAQTLGIKLIAGLAKQLSGNVGYAFDKGSVFTVDFKDTFLRKSESQ